jgi:Flp pilus assembly protein TadG
MNHRFELATLLSRFRHSRRGNILIIAALMSTVLVYSVGVAVDYMRDVQYRTELQSTADSAALAGATAFTSCSTSGDGSQTNAETISKNYFNATGVAGNNGTITVGATGSTTGASQCSGGSGNPTAYVMTVTASGNVPTTFMSIVMNSMAVSVTATAKNPVISATANAGGWFSSAYDANYIYWYPIPQDGSVPTFNNSGNVDGSGNLKLTNGVFHLLFTNMATPISGGGSLASSQNFSVAASQKIGFVLHNVTGGRIGYGSGQYNGQSAGSIHTMYSQLNNPNGATDNSGNAISNGGYSSGYYNPSSPHYPLLTCTNNGSSYPCGNVQNCSLQIRTTTANIINNNPSVAQNAVPQNVCLGVTAQPFAGQNCQQLGSQALYYSWNDMGGGFDDMDYNDAEFGFYCNAGGAISRVLLTN